MTLTKKQIKTQQLLTKAALITGHSEDEVERLTGGQRLASYIRSWQTALKNSWIRPAGSPSVERLEQLERRSEGRESEQLRLQQSAMIQSEEHKRLMMQWGPSKRLRWQEDIPLVVAAVRPRYETQRQKAMIHIVSAPPLLEELCRRSRLGDRSAAMAFAGVVCPLLKAWADSNGFGEVGQEIKFRQRVQSPDTRILISAEVMPNFGPYAVELKLIAIGTPN